MSALHSRYFARMRKANAEQRKGVHLDTIERYRREQRAALRANKQWISEVKWQPGDHVPDMLRERNRERQDSERTA